jgi:frataxin
MMNDFEFEKLANKEIEDLSDFLEQHFSSLEIELNSGILEMQLKNVKFVINKHLPSKQIWYSSTSSGAKRFFFIDNAWKDDNGNELSKFAKKELETI